MIEIRRNADGTIDEIFATAVRVHVEQMAAGHWWMGLTCPDGSGWHVNWHSKRGATITCRVEPEADPDPRHGYVTMDRFAIDDLIARCLPGGYAMDPQQVADAIRQWFLARGVASDGGTAAAGPG